MQLSLSVVSLWFGIGSYSCLEQYEDSRSDETKGQLILVFALFARAVSLKGAASAKVP